MEKTQLAKTQEAAAWLTKELENLHSVLERMGAPEYRSSMMHAETTRCEAGLHDDSPLPMSEVLDGVLADLETLAAGVADHKAAVDIQLGWMHEAMADFYGFPNIG